jgi:hypothetical protein
MRERVPAPTGEPTAEATATTGLFLLVTAVIATAVCLGSCGLSDGLLALVAGVVALFSFITSIVCFVAQAEEGNPRKLNVG